IAMVQNWLRLGEIEKPCLELLLCWYFRVKKIDDLGISLGNLSKSEVHSGESEFATPCIQSLLLKVPLQQLKFVTHLMTPLAFPLDEEGDALSLTPHEQIMTEAKEAIHATPLLADIA